MNARKECGFHPKVDWGGSKGYSKRLTHRLVRRIVRREIRKILNPRVRDRES